MKSSLGSIMQNDSATLTSERLAYDVPALCAAIGISRSGIDKLLQTGALPARKLGGRTIILKSDLEIFLKNLPARPVERARP